ncbi:lysine-specific demethylase 2A-like [Sesbania bispinosa]|nr:lysine-specific demethylase 2A-like [Sesbania bispinosa]
MNETQKRTSTSKKGWCLQGGKQTKYFEEPGRTQLMNIMSEQAHFTNINKFQETIK